MLKKSKKQIKIPEVIYEVSLANSEEAERSIERAFDVLFESILKNYQLNKKDYGK